MQAWLIPDDLAAVLLEPKTADESRGRKKRKRSDGNARIISTIEVEQELLEKKNKKNQDKRRSREKKIAKENRTRKEKKSSRG